MYYECINVKINSSILCIRHNICDTVQCALLILVQVSSFYYGLSLIIDGTYIVSDVVDKA